MPEGLAVLKWDDELGPVVTAKTPKGLKLGLDPTTSMRVYGIATLGETEEAQRPGFSSLPFPDFKLAVYYGGLNMHLKGLPSMVFLVLGTDEDPDAYKDALPEIATQIFLNAEGNAYTALVPKLYKQISRYTHMTPEQRQASVVNDPVRRAILQSLMKRGSILSTDLEQLIFEEVGKKIDVEMVLRPLVKMGIITTGWVEGLSSEVVHLTRAILIQRTIPADTVKQLRSGYASTDVAKQYISSTKRYHKEYIARLRMNLHETVWHEAEELARIILDFDSYDIIQLLRKGPQIQSSIPALLDLKESVVKKKIRELEKSNITITIADDEGIKHVFLKCNPEVLTVYPEWLVERTVDLYNEEDIQSRQAVHYLEQLKINHPSNVSAKSKEAL